jgi:DNA-binding response OmpR family regulator
VLIVEPEEDVRGLYFDWFCSAAFDIMCAVDGTVTHALAERYPPDLVVAELDAGFPFSPPRISACYTCTRRFRRIFVAFDHASLRHVEARSGQRVS